MVVYSYNNILLSLQLQHVDIKSEIRQFIFGHCEYCGLINYYWQLKRNVVFYEYVSMFHDYYIYDQNPLKFNIMCVYCYQIHTDNYHYITI